MYIPLERSIYASSAKVVAPKLLGHFLLRRIGDEICGGEIVETEAYLQGDPACHGFAGETPRNRAIWGEAGHAYIYLIYGMYFCFNTSCNETGIGEAVLVRAIVPSIGLETMQENRKVLRLRDLTNGPGKLCGAMAIDRSQDGIDLCDENSSVFIARNPQVNSFKRRHKPVVCTTRIGLKVAAEMPLRWYLGGTDAVSKR